MWWIEKICMSIRMHTISIRSAKSIGKFLLNSTIINYFIEQMKRFLHSNGKLMIAKWQHSVVCSSGLHRQQADKTNSITM